jgi:hypothetical protein
VKFELWAFSLWGLTLKVKALSLRFNIWTFFVRFEGSLPFVKSKVWTFNALREVQSLAHMSNFTPQHIAFEVHFKFLGRRSCNLVMKFNCFFFFSQSRNLYSLLPLPNVQIYCCSPDTCVTYLPSSSSKFQISDSELDQNVWTIFLVLSWLEDLSYWFWSRSDLWSITIVKQIGSCWYKFKEVSPREQGQGLSTPKTNYPHLFTLLQLFQ